MMLMGILLLLAFVFLVLAAVNVPARGVSLGWLGLALWMLTLVMGRG